MAVHMAASASASQAMGSGHGAMPADCPMMIKAESSEKGSHDGGNKSARGCQSCQLCMALTVPEILAINVMSCEPVSAAIPCADRFISADLVRAVKPPIS